MERQRVKTEPLVLKVTHPYEFRCGEFARVIGVFMVTPEGKEPRLCYASQYDDGFVDYKSCDSAGDLYELEVEK